MEAVKALEDSTVLAPEMARQEPTTGEIRRRMSYEEFLAQIDEDQHAELGRYG